MNLSVLIHSVGPCALPGNLFFPDTQSFLFYGNHRLRFLPAFPYVGRTLFFPKPKWHIWKDMDISHFKIAKKIRWLSKGLLGRIVAGKPIDFQEIMVLDGVIGVSREEFDENDELSASLPWVLCERQRVGVDRLGAVGDGALFFFALQFFSPSSGLYFMVDLPEDETDRFRSALAFLGDTGLGADRNSGLGHFKVVGDEQFSIEVHNKKGRLNLSLFNPGTNDDIRALTQMSAYELITTGGLDFR